MTEQTIADAIADTARRQAFGGKLLATDATVINQLASQLFARYPIEPRPVGLLNVLLTLRTFMETIQHEAIVLEAYKDSEGIWTWAVGLTKASGIDPLKYKDKPSTLLEALIAFVNRVRASYAKEVLKAFDGIALTENEFAALLAFHYNTGAIMRSDLTDLIRAGNHTAARKFWTGHYLNGGDLLERRKAEAALFYDGKWSTDGKTGVIVPVGKPSYTPAFRNSRRLDISVELAKAMAA